jgi:hypothetical protein
VDFIPISSIYSRQVCVSRDSNLVVVRSSKRLSYLFLSNAIVAIRIQKPKQAGCPQEGRAFIVQDHHYLRGGALPQTGNTPMTKHRTHNHEFKGCMTMEAISGRKTHREIAADYAVLSIQVSQWKKQLFDGASDLFFRGKKTQGKGSAVQGE